MKTKKKEPNKIKLVKNVKMKRKEKEKKNKETKKIYCTFEHEIGRA